MVVILLQNLLEDVKKKMLSIHTNIYQNYPCFYRTKKGVQVVYKKGIQTSNVMELVS